MENREAKEPAQKRVQSFPVNLYGENSDCHPNFYYNNEKGR
jgi:hypothetical protein